MWAQELTGILSMWTLVEYIPAFQKVRPSVGVENKQSSGLGGAVPSDILSGNEPNTGRN